MGFCEKPKAGRARVSAALVVRVFVRPFGVLGVHHFREPEPTTGGAA